MPSLVIPPDKFDVYLRYKKGTREIVAWLMKFGSRKYKNAKTITIRDLTHIVETMSTKKITMPETIHYLFRETISARSQLSKFFRDQFASNTEDPDTVNHEFFTNSAEGRNASVVDGIVTSQSRIRFSQPGGFAGYDIQRGTVIYRKKNGRRRF
ncbi:MAG: hypothetical protein Q9160_004520 [Pyrenula sp. 1 TL-2023]